MGEKPLRKSAGNLLIWINLQNSTVIARCLNYELIYFQIVWHTIGFFFMSYFLSNVLFSLKMSPLFWPLTDSYGGKTPAQSQLSFQLQELTQVWNVHSKAKWISDIFFIGSGSIDRPIHCILETTRYSPYQSVLSGPTRNRQNFVNSVR